MLRALINEIEPKERLITIEDNFELGLDRYPDLHPDVVALEGRQSNVEGEGEVSLADLVRWGLRMNPDRVIVGEVRRSEEHTSELQSLMRISYAVFCLKKKNNIN